MGLKEFHLETNESASDLMVRVHNYLSNNGITKFQITTIPIEYEPQYGGFGNNIIKSLYVSKIRVCVFY